MHYKLCSHRDALEKKTEINKCISKCAVTVMHFENKKNECITKDAIAVMHLKNTEINKCITECAITMVHFENINK